MGSVCSWCKTRKEVEEGKKAKLLATEENTTLTEKYDEDGILILYHNKEFPREHNYEKELNKLTTDYIRDLLDKYETDNTGYEHKIDTPNIQLWLKTDEETKLPLGKMCFYFDEKYKAKDIIDIMFNCERRKKWDKNMLEFYEIEKSMPCYTIYYMGMKSPWPFSNRDFASKRIVFKWRDVYYLFYSAMPETYMQKKDGYERAITLFGGVTIRKENGRIRYFQTALTDLRLAVLPQSILKVFVPTATKNLYDNIVKQLEVDKVN